LENEFSVKIEHVVLEVFLFRKALKILEVEVAVQAEQLEGDLPW
jgi:hypothetical protein